MGKQPEIQFQEHIAKFLVREHGYAVLEQNEITDTNHAIAEDHLWAFLNDSQPEVIKKLSADYGTDARDEVFRALASELKHTPLWLVIRNGLKVRGLEFRLYYPKARSSESVSTKLYDKNRITLRPHFYFGDKNEEVDLVLFLNGLPIIAIEVKHEKNQNVHDAVSQFATRDHSLGIFQSPFLYVAADTSDVMVATDPRHEKNFRWFNSGLKNSPLTAGEYPIEYLYREVFSKENILESLSFFLVYVPRRDAEGDKQERSAFTLFPRYHQGRMVRSVTEDALAHFVSTTDIGRKYLINHSAGSGKTLSICWLADRLHSLYKPGTSEKLVDIVFVLTDRRSLDKNIRDDVENFVHLKDIVGLAKKAEDLPRFIADRKSIVITTQQKFAWILEQLENNPALKKLRVAFLIDEAHRSQEGRLGAAIRKPFRERSSAETPDIDGDDESEDEEEIARIIREHDRNQLFVAFTATPAPATVTLFGETFDTYTEAEAIAEGYIVDVAASIISYETLYHLQSRIVPKLDEEKLYPKGVVSKALKNVAYADDGLIQYKSEVMLRIFEDDVRPLINGRAKAMIVTSSRIAGLRYFQIIKEKLRERKASYKVLYAFSDFVDPESNESISEHAVNGLDEGEQIEDRFDGDDYRIMVVANKFQTGFNQPLLAGMFIDKPVVDRNAVQTVSRLNRAHDGKAGVVVVDFTNNAKAILKAFTKYREGTPFPPGEPDEKQCQKLQAEILSAGVFSIDDAHRFVRLLIDADDATIQARVAQLRTRFQERIVDADRRKEFVYLLGRFVRSYHFLTCFFSFPKETKELAVFAEYVGPQLIKLGSISELMRQIRQTAVVKAAVQYKGEVTTGGPVKKPSSGGAKSGGVPPTKVTVREMIDELRQRFPITDDEALYIREVTEEKTADPGIRVTVEAHRTDLSYLNDTYKVHVNKEIQSAYYDRERFDELIDPKYIEAGAIFDIMAYTVIQHHL